MDLINRGIEMSAAMQGYDLLLSSVDIARARARPQDDQARRQVRRHDPARPGARPRRHRPARRAVPVVTLSGTPTRASVAWPGTTRPGCASWPGTWSTTTATAARLHLRPCRQPRQPRPRRRRARGGRRSGVPFAAGPAWTATTARPAAPRRPAALDGRRRARPGRSPAPTTRPRWASCTRCASTAWTCPAMSPSPASTTSVRPAPQPPADHRAPAHPGDRRPSLRGPAQHDHADSGGSAPEERPGELPTSCSPPGWSAGPAAAVPARRPCRLACGARPLKEPTMRLRSASAGLLPASRLRRRDPELPPAAHAARQRRRRDALQLPRLGHPGPAPRRWSSTTASDTTRACCPST